MNNELTKSAPSAFSASSLAVLSVLRSVTSRATVRLMTSTMRMLRVHVDFVFGPSPTQIDRVCHEHRPTITQAVPNFSPAFRIDPEALDALVERHRHRLFALAYARLRHCEDAQDAVATALLRICQHVGQLRQPGQMASWMFSVVRNEAIRLRQHRPAWFSGEVPDDAEAPDAPAQAAIDREW